MHRTVPCLLVLALSAAAPAQKSDGPPKVRTFIFTYSAKVTDLPAGKTAHVWVPLPATNEEQEVKLVSEKFPGLGTVSSEPQYGNRFLHVEAMPGPDGTIPIELTFRIKRKEILGVSEDQNTDAKRIDRFLKPDELVPISGKPLDLLKDRKLPDDPQGKAKAFYDIVYDHMKYDKSGSGWGRGDAAWACDSRFGNCTDFHSLFISLARANKIPAKFEIGFGIPPQRGKGEVGGYHCWAKFRPSDKGWVGVDISEADKDPKMKDYYFGNLTEDRVTFSVGRDITLSPPQKGKPVNFIVYPYVEVDGNPYPAEKVTKKFAYEDVK